MGRKHVDYEFYNLLNCMNLNNDPKPCKHNSFSIFIIWKNGLISRNSIQFIQDLKSGMCVKWMFLHPQISIEVIIILYVILEYVIYVRIVNLKLSWKFISLLLNSDCMWSGSFYHILTHIKCHIWNLISYITIAK